MHKSLALLFCLVSIMSCTTKNLSDNLVLSVKNLYFPMEGASQKINFNSQSDYLVEIDNNAIDWISYEKNDGGLIITALPNYTGETRKCILIIVSGEKKHEIKVSQEFNRVVLAYVYSGQQQKIDPFAVTHINYAFGQINPERNGIDIENIAFFQEICDLKKVNPRLKILLSICGAGANECLAFYQMVMNPDNRKAFARDCGRVLTEYNIDGIDLDWETPYSSQEIQNFNKLSSEIRKEIGAKKLITFAAPASAVGFDFKTLVKTIDYVNLMGYDIDWPPYHHAGLYRSEHTGKMCIEESVHKFINLGVPPHQLVLGFPCYGLGVGTANVPKFVNFRDLNILQDVKECWDEKAQAPYYANNKGELVLSFDNVRSVKAKCDFVKKMKLLGMMYWTYGEDDDQGTLRYAVSKELR